MTSIVRSVIGISFMAAIVGIDGTCQGDTPVPPTAVFEENFNSYADGEQPSSIFEVQDRQLDSGETIGGRYAINHGNRHMLVAPRVGDFDLKFTVEPHARALRSPMMTVEFRTDPQGLRGYRIAHWFGTYSRLDLVRWDNTVSPPVVQKLASPQMPELKLPVNAPIRFRLTARGRAIEFSREDRVLMQFAVPGDASGPAESGQIVFSSHPATWIPEEASPLYFDDIRLETPDPVKAIRPLFQRRYDIPADVRAASVPSHHDLEIAEVADTGLDALRTDATGGRVFRVTAGVQFPVLDGQKARATAALTPYIRLERPSGGVILKQRIFNGILGGMRPGLPAGGAAQLLRLMTSSADPPRYGVALHTQQAADATGPQSSTRSVTALPEDFNVVVGWESFMDNDHLEASGPVEAIYHRDGKLLYAGPPLRVGDMTLALDSPPPTGLIARVSEKNANHKGFVQRFKGNHYFLEGDPVRFTVSMAAGPKTPLPEAFQWQLLDAYRRPIEGAQGTRRFAAATNDLATTLRGIGRELVAADLPIGPLKPGVYWLDIDADGVASKRAFSVVPAKRRSGNTAAYASGLPSIAGQFYPAMPTIKDAGHYVSESNARDADWQEMLSAFNMKITGLPPGVKLPETKLSYSPGLRIWTAGSFSSQAVQAFLASKEYTARPDDAALQDPKASDADRQRIIRRSHFKEWIDHWCRVRTDNDAAQRTTWNKHTSGSEYCSYGPPLINTFYYGNLYGGRYYGWDGRLVADSLRLIDVFKMETYPHDFGRQHASYTPSIAQTKMAFPTAGCGWEMYGAQGYVIDNRTAEGRAPNGLGYPSRNFLAHQVTEQTLGPWYFADDALHPAGHTHIAPATGQWTQEMLFGMIDGLRASADVKSLTPLRSPAFVSSWAAADLDPSWQRGDVNNAAAETPAYAYLQSRLAGLAGGFFLDIADVSKLDRRRTDVLVLPPMRGATADQIAAIRRLHTEGVSLVGFDDATGLEDLFGIRRLREGVAFRAVERAAKDTLLAGLETAALTERISHDGTAWYELADATEVLSALDGRNRRVAPMLTLHRRAKGPGAVFFAAGATEIGRRRHQPDDLNLEGEVVSRLVQHALRRCMLSVADPVAVVSPPATVLAFRRPDDSLSVVVMESSWPFSSGLPQEVDLLLRGPGAETATLECEHPFREGPKRAGERRLTMILEPDEVVSVTVVGMQDKQPQPSDGQ